MKKSIFILGAMTLLAVSLNSCGSGACDCLKQSQKLMQEVAANPTDSGLQKKAEELQKECSKYSADDLINCN
jgi:hypothetical protein